MYRGPSQFFKVVTDPNERYAVWFADAPRQYPWLETGCCGSLDECWDYVEANESSDGFWLHFPLESS